MNRLVEGLRSSSQPSLPGLPAESLSPSLTDAEMAERLRAAGYQVVDPNTLDARRENRETAAAVLEDIRRQLSRYGHSIARIDKDDFARLALVVDHVQQLLDLPPLPADVAASIDRLNHKPAQPMTNVAMLIDTLQQWVAGQGITLSQRTEALNIALAMADQITTGKETA